MVYIYDYPMSSLTGDMVILRSKGFNSFDVLMVTRKNEPFAGKLAIVGGFVNPDETFRDAAIRECAEEVHINATQYEIHPAGYADEPYRDPRGRVISGIFYIVVPSDVDYKADDDALSAEWVDDDYFDDASEKYSKGMFAFDHLDIVRRVLHAEKRRYVR